MAELFEYKCPCCGGAIAFDSASQNLKCPYCDTELEVETLKAYDDCLNKNKTEEKGQFKSEEKNWEDGECDGLASYVCKSCGGEIVGDSNTAATSCPFCGNPVIVTENFSGMYHPDFVIPFKLDKKAAKAALLKHMKHKPLLPKTFKDENHIEELIGMYVPFWLYSCQADGAIQMRATRVKTWSDSNYYYTRTLHYLVSRSGSLGFSNVPADASSKMDDAYMDSIEPYDYSDMTEFRTAYLAGYVADKYDVDADADAKRVTDRVDESTIKALEDTVVGYSTKVTSSSNVNYKDMKSSYAMLPVWILNTKYKDKMYKFAMNGQTGRFIGELPVDKKRCAAWFFGIMGASAAVIALIALLLGVL